MVNKMGEGKVLFSQHYVIQSQNLLANRTRPHEFPPQSDFGSGMGAHPQKELTKLAQAKEWESISKLNNSDTQRAFCATICLPRAKD